MHKNENSGYQSLPYKIYLAAALLALTSCFLFALTQPVRMASIGFMVTGILGLVAFHAYTLYLNKSRRQRSGFMLRFLKNKR